MGPQPWHQLHQNFLSPGSCSASHAVESRRAHDSMDRYKASIQSVDTALNRLNQTLASYKLLISESSKATPAPVPGKAPLTSSTEVTSQEQRVVAPNCASPCVTTVAGRDTTARTGPIQQRPPVERLICGLRASKIYPEVRINNTSQRSSRSHKHQGKLIPFVAQCF